MTPAVDAEIGAYLGRRGAYFPQPATLHGDGILEIPVLDLGGLQDRPSKQRAIRDYLNERFPHLQARAVWLREVRLVVNDGGGR